MKHHYSRNFKIILNPFFFFFPFEFCVVIPKLLAWPVVTIPQCNHSQLSETTTSLEARKHSSKCPTSTKEDQTKVEKIPQVYRRNFRVLVTASPRLQTRHTHRSGLMHRGNKRLSKKWHVSPKTQVAKIVRQSYRHLSNRTQSLVALCLNWTGRRAATNRHRVYTPGQRTRKTWVSTTGLKTVL